METVIVRTTQKEDDNDRFEVLEQILEESGFWNRLEERLVNSGKTKKDFIIAIKPNLMMFYSEDDWSIITEPALVEHLINKIVEKGYTNIALVESQNVLGNWFENRDVHSVAFNAGYSEKNYTIVDLTTDTVAHVYHGYLGTYLVGKTWRDADFRISFAKNKTNVNCYYSLTIKNICGILPEQNKFVKYHVNDEIDKVTIEMLKEFPVHFGLIDGIFSADGFLGIKLDCTPNHTKTLIAGENIIAVDIVGGKKMGIDPVKNSFVKLAIETFGEPEISPYTDYTKYKNWKNVPSLGKTYLGDEWYGFSIFLTYLSSRMDASIYPEKFHLESSSSLATGTIFRLIAVNTLESRIGFLMGPILFFLVYVHQSLISKEFRNKANIAYKKSKGTPTEEIAFEVKQKINKFNTGNTLLLARKMEEIAGTLRLKIPDIPENRNIYNEIKNFENEFDLLRRAEKLNILIALIPTAIVQKGGILINGKMHGDVIQVIDSTNVSIVNKSSFSKAVSTIREKRDDDIAKSIEELTKLIESASFKEKSETLENVENLVEEAAKPNPKKSKLRAYGEFIVNTVKKVSEIAEKTAPLINIISKLWL